MSDHADPSWPIRQYSHLVDGRRWDRLGEVFTDDGSFVVEGSPVALHGLAAVRDWMASFGGHPIAHFVTNIVVEQDADDHATATSLVFGPEASGRANIAAYSDELVRTSEGWRLRYRTVTMRERGWGRSTAQAG